MRYATWLFSAALAALTAAAHSAPLFAYEQISQGEFNEATLDGEAYLALRVGDSLHPGTVGGGTDAELVAGTTVNSLAEAAQFDWPVNWMLSQFTLAYRREEQTLTLSLQSGDPNGRPAAASVATSVEGGIRSLYVGGTATVAALYAHPMDLNGGRLPSLSPNGYGYAATSSFEGFLITGDALADDFFLTGLIYFDGGNQGGTSNRVEFVVDAQPGVISTPAALWLVLTSLVLCVTVRARRPRTTP